jgi:hypothetical protein
MVKIPSGLTIKPDGMPELKFLKLWGDTLQIFKLW